MPARTAAANGTSDEPIGEKPARRRQVGDAQAVEKLDDRVTGERDEAPEHERVRGARDRPLADRRPLQDDVEEEPLKADAEVVERKVARAPRRSAGRAWRPAPRRRRRPQQESPQSPEGI